MEEATRKKEAKDLRKGLRDGRTGKAGSDVDSASTGVGGNSQGDGGTPGHSVQNASRGTKTQYRSNATHERNSGSPGNGSGSVNTEPRRIGLATRRPGESDSGAIDLAERGNGATTRTAGRLETDEPIVERKEEDKPEFTFKEEETSLAKNQQRYREDYFRTKRDGQNVYALISDKAQIIDSDKYNSLTNAPKTRESDQKREGRSWLNSLSFGKLANSSSTHDSLNSSNSQDRTKASESAKEAWHVKLGPVLSIKEAEELYEPFVAALQSGFEYIDKGIWLYSMSEDKDPIWSDISDKEVQVLAKIILKRGQRNEETAAFVRAMVDSDIYIQVGTITVPRAMKTYQMIKGSPRPEMRRKQREARKQAGQGGRPQ